MASRRKEARRPDALVAGSGTTSFPTAAPAQTCAERLSHASRRDITMTTE